MTSVEVYRLPKTTDPVLLEIQSKPLRLARLKSLQLDPQAFKSKYEDEITQPPEFWLNRLRPEDCQHFVAAVSSANDSKEVEYKAFMVVLAAPVPTEEHNLPTYELAAFWVDPEMRGQKTGSKVVAESIRWIREDASINGWKRVRYQLNVKPDNHRAVNLYKRLGFSFTKENSGEDATDKDHLVEMNMTIDMS